MNSQRKDAFAKSGKEITQQEYIDYDGMCWKCWGNQLNEESDSMFEDLT